MARFSSFQDFYGTYFGKYDGRKAQLVISPLKSAEEVSTCQLTFIELERNLVFRGTATEGEQPHILTNMVLYQIRGHDKITWSRLYLHTWDINYLSGVSIAYGIEYGMSFQRETEQ